MQNRYIGDVGDFGKYGLLRFLSGMTDDKDSQLRLGLVWYLHPNEGSSADGKFVSFLMPTEKDDKSEYRNCDCELWGKLRDMVLRNARCVYCAQGAGILPDDTAFYDAPLHFPPQMPKPTRQEVRKFWLSGALQKTNGADMVYLDPDNGIADAKKMYLRDGPKFTYMDDIRRFWGPRAILGHLPPLGIRYQGERPDSEGRHQHPGHVGGGANPAPFPPGVFPRVLRDSCAVPPGGD